MTELTLWSSDIEQYLCDDIIYFVRLISFLIYVVFIVFIRKLKFLDHLCPTLQIFKQT